MELERFVCDRATLSIIEKLLSEGGVMHGYGVSVYYAQNRKSIKWTWAEPFEIKVKIKQELNFVVDNDS